MPFDCTDHREPSGWHDPAPTWRDRVFGCAAFAIYGAFLVLPGVIAVWTVATDRWLIGGLLFGLRAIVGRCVRVRLPELRDMAAGRWP